MAGVFCSICGGRIVPRHHITSCRPPVRGLLSRVMMPWSRLMFRDAASGASFGGGLETQPDEGISVGIEFRFAAASIQSESCGAGLRDVAMISAAFAGVGLLDASWS